MIKVIAIDDHPLMLRSIVEILSLERDITVIGQSDRAQNLLQLIREHPEANVLILDPGMPFGEPFNPLTEIPLLKQRFPDVHVLVLSGEDNPLIVRKVIEAGTKGYLLKDDNLTLRLAEAVRTVARRQRFYSPRILTYLFESPLDTCLNDSELGILRLLSEGYSNKGIARALNLSEKTVRNMLPAIYLKLGIEHGNREASNLRVIAANKAREMMS